MSKPATILFVAYGGGHVNMILPVVSRLREQRTHRCVTLGLTTAGPVFHRHGERSRGFASIIRPEDEEARVWGKTLMRELPFNGDVPEEESVAYLGLSYQDLEQRMGREAAAQQYGESGRQAFLPLGPLRRLFDDVRPDVVVATTSPRAEEAAIRVSQEREIPSLCITDFFQCRSLERLALPGYGTRVCVISESTKKWFVARGRSRDEIVVTGNPAFDSLVSPVIRKAAQGLRRKKGWEGERVVLWASQVEPSRNPFTGRRGDPTLPRRIEEELRGVISRRRHWRLIVRPHPNENRSKFQTSERVEISPSSDPLHVLLHAVDAVVIMTSTVGLEARLIGKPVVSVDASVFSQDTPFSKVGLSRGVSDLDKLERALESALASPLEIPGGYAAPGNATEAVVAQIEKLARGRSGL